VACSVRGTRTAPDCESVSPEFSWFPSRGLTRCCHYLDVSINVTNSRRALSIAAHLPATDDGCGHPSHNYLMRRAQQYGADWGGGVISKRFKL
jgi:hypothetical protein